MQSLLCRDTRSELLRYERMYSRSPNHSPELLSVMGTAGCAVLGTDLAVAVQRQRTAFHGTQRLHVCSGRGIRLVGSEHRIPAAHVDGQEGSRESVPCAGWIDLFGGYAGYCCDCAAVMEACPIPSEGLAHNGTGTREGSRVCPERFEFSFAGEHERRDLRQAIESRRR